MANQARRKRIRQSYQNGAYQVSGSAAYQPDFNGPAVRKPRPESRPQIRPRRQPAARPQVQVRPAGTVSLLAVAGFAAVAVCAALFLVLNAQLMVLNDETVDLRAQLKDLQAQEVTLLAKRDRLYDLEAIAAQFTASGAMVKPQPSQVTYLSADRQDSLVKYGRPRQSLLDALYEKMQEISAGLFS